MPHDEERGSGRPGKLGEILGLLCFVVAALFGLALLSYFVGDGSFNMVNYPTREPVNAVGRVGAHLADLLIQFGGYASWFLPVMFALLGYFFFTGRSVRLKLSQLFGYLILLVFVAAILSTFLPQFPRADAGGGGWIGGVMATLLHLSFGRVGAMLVAITMVLISLIITVNFSFLGAGALVKRGVTSAYTALGAWWTVRREQRRRRERRDQREPAPGAERGEPVIRFGAEAEARAEPKPAARGAKPRKRDADAPVRSTVIEVAAPVAAAPVIEPPRPAPPPLPPEPITPEPAFVEEMAPPRKPKPPRPKEGAPESKRMEQEAITIHEQAETQTARQISFTQLVGEYEPPPLDLFKKASQENKELDREALLAQSVTLEAKLETLGVTGKVAEIHPGPVITMFEYEPAPGIKISRIANLDDDLAMALQAEKVRIIAPIPGKGAVGIEIPSLRREIVYLREIVESKEFNDAKAPLTVAFGKDSSGRPFVQDLAKMPHLLIAGTTGSGKSVFLNCMIMSLLYKSTPEQVRLLMVDPKQLELSMYTGIPHMLHPVITEPKKAALLLRWAVAEMEDRYRRLAELGVRNIENYNEKASKAAAKMPRHGTITGEEPPPVPEKLPYIVLIIDELADLMMIAAKEVEDSIARLAQMARAAGIHLILATQRPSVDVITGVIKANFPSRISFQVRSRVDSRTILDETGAHNLLGMGDALFLPPGSAKLTRFHSAFISDEEVHAAVDYLKKKHPTPSYVEIRTPTGADLHEASLDEVSLDDDGDVDQELFDKAVDIVARDRKASVSYIQRRLKIGYNRSARIIERMEQEGMIGPSDGTSRPRDVYLPETNYE
jgi:S-DNA-T family DNA segregation ATPase FtsK/SpoIIIE